MRFGVFLFCISSHEFEVGSMAGSIFHFNDLKNRSKQKGAFLVTFPKSVNFFVPLTSNNSPGFSLFLVHVRVPIQYSK
jgi:hypothetical protein